MKMRPEFNYIREYNSQTIEIIIASNDTHRLLKEALRELNYYRTAEPAAGLDTYCQIIVWQIIKGRKNELYDEISRLKRRISYLANRYNVSKFLVELHTASY